MKVNSLEDPSDITNNIMPIILKVASGEMSNFPIYGLIIILKMVIEQETIFT